MYPTISARVLQSLSDVVESVTAAVRVRDPKSIAIAELEVAKLRDYLAVLSTEPSLDTRPPQPDTEDRISRLSIH